jgi:hypothetical protein
MTDERKRFRATDVITGKVEKRSTPPLVPAKSARKRVTLHLTHHQIAVLDNLYRQVNTPDLTKKIEKSELGGLAIELLARLLPTGLHFADANQISGYLDTQISGYPDIPSARRRE